MADVKISDMNAGAALSGAELLEMVQSGATFSTTTGEVSFAAKKWGSFASVVDQTGSTSNPTPVLLATDIVANQGVTVVTNGSGLTRITYAVAGTYQIDATLQCKNANAAQQSITVWLRKNGTDIANSASILSVLKTGEGGLIPFHYTRTEALTAGQYLEIIWLVGSADVTLDFTAAAVGPPAIAAIPSAYVTTQRIA